MRFLLPSFLCLFVAACDNADHHQPFATYVDRLERTLDEATAPTQPPLNIPRRPRSGQLRLSVPADDLDVLDFMDLRGCALQETIGKRNSILGRHARDSQRLLLELEFLRLAPECADKLESDGDKPLADQLRRNWDDKRQQLPARIFNATLGNDEFAAFWRPTSLNREYPANTSSVPVTAMAAITALARQWLGGDYSADNRAFELLLYDVSTGDGGTLWLALEQQAAWLATADKVVDQRRARGPLCRGKIRPEAADILPKVVTRFFIQGIQPRAAHLNQRYHQLLPPVQALEALLDDVIPEDYQRWQSTRDSDFARNSDAPRQHVQHLQALLESCGGIRGN